MKHLAIILLLFYSLLTCGQEFGMLYTSGCWTVKDVQKDIEKSIENGKNKQTVLSSFKSQLNDTVTYIVRHLVDAYTLKFTFNIKENDDSYCDFQEYLFDCTPCSEKHLTEFLNSYFYGFRKTSENNYLSKFSWKTEMEIKYREGNKNYFIIIFKTSKRPKEEYKKYYKTLQKNKKTTA